MPRERGEHSTYKPVMLAVPLAADTSRAAAGGGAGGGAFGAPQALSTGPVLLADADTRQLLHSIDSRAMRSGRDLIQTQFGGADLPSNLTGMTEKVGRRSHTRMVVVQGGGDDCASRGGVAASSCRSLVVTGLCVSMRSCC
jgi:hypothetical protein